MPVRVSRKSVFNQPSWQVVSSTVEANVTETGGQPAPVTFDRKGRQIQPYPIAPWWNEKVDKAVPAIVRVLRGDFFCMPFGGNEEAFRGERFPVHGETANAKWKLESLRRDAGGACLHLSLRTKVRKGRVDKYIRLIDGHNAVYCKHVISGISGPTHLWHHANVRFPDEPGSGVLSTSPFVFGQVWVEPTENPADKGYSILKPGAIFKSLARVPTITGESADLTRYPARRGFEDIAHIIADPKRRYAWTAVTFPKQRYVWFALKDPKVLNGTLFWMSNGGRHYAPWNGRHVNNMGLEELTSYFHTGIAPSAKANSHTRRGIRTVLNLSATRQTVVNYIMAVASIPAGFDRVKDIQLSKGRAVLIAASGKRVTVPLNGEFVWSGK